MTMLGELSGLTVFPSENVPVVGLSEMREVFRGLHLKVGSREHPVLVRAGRMTRINWDVGMVRGRIDLLANGFSLDISLPTDFVLVLRLASDIPKPRGHAIIKDLFR